MDQGQWKRGAAAAAMLIAVGFGRAQAANVHADFDGDGYDDLAIGIEAKDVGAATHAGAVSVLYGTTAGISGRRSQFWTEDSPGMPDVAETDDSFGRALAAGDFNGDGRADLAVGVPGQTVNGRSGAGSLHVLYGTANGLDVAGTQLWTENSPGVPGTATVKEYFADALASGDFDGDGYDDLAIGVPNGTVGKGPHALAAGTVIVLYGSPQGLSAARARQYSQASPGIASAPEAHDGFGLTLATGDFDHDGYADLVIGAPFEADDADPSKGNAGIAHVIYGAKGGLSGSRRQSWQQVDTGLTAAAQGWASFGVAFATGDFDHDGFADLAIGAPGLAVGNQTGAGALVVLRGDAGGLTASGATVLSEATPGVLGGIGFGDAFGGALVAGDFNHDGYADLAVGAPYKGSGVLAQAGGMHVFFGAPGGVDRFDGIAGFDDLYWDRDTPGIEGVAAANQHYGGVLASADWNGDGYADLAVGVYFESPGGAVHVLYGSPAGPASGNDVLWSLDSPGVAGVAAPNDGFGAALAP